MRDRDKYIKDVIDYHEKLHRKYYELSKNKRSEKDNEILINKIDQAILKILREKANLN